MTVGMVLCHHQSMAYDPAHLIKMGRKFQDLRAGLENLRLELAAEIRSAAAGGYRQVDIVRATGYTRDQVRLIVKDAPR